MEQRLERVHRQANSRRAGQVERDLLAGNRDRLAVREGDGIFNAVGYPIDATGGEGFLGRVRLCIGDSREGPVDVPLRTEPP